MTVSQAEALHADRAVSLGPAVAGNPQRILQPLAQVALLLHQPRSCARVQVGGSLDPTPNPKRPTQPVPCHLKLLPLLILLGPQLWIT